MDDEIKSCPFCGEKATIKNEIRLNRNNESLTPNHDFEVSWSISCNYCGTSKKAFGSTYYRLKKNGEFEIVPQTFNKDYKGYVDKRKEVIDLWNRRFS